MRAASLATVASETRSNLRQRAQQRINNRWRPGMNRSALNGEVEYHLRMLEREQLPEQVEEVEKKQPGVLARVVALFARGRHGRRSPEVRRQEREGEEQYRERFAG
jgi:hypothetical protein